MSHDGFPGLSHILSALMEVPRIPAERARSMPAGFYTSPEFLEVERDRVFRREWVAVGHTGEIPQPGDYFTTELVGEPLLVLRSQRNAVNVFSNVCRHRGNLVAEGSGNKKRLVCGYHAWTYDDEGALLAAPLMDRVAHFDRASCGLKRMRAEIWQNFIFVNLSGDATPLGPRLQALLPHIRNYHNEERHLYYCREEIWKTNWKCLAENFMEAYHLSVTHLKTLHPFTPTSLSERVPAGDCYSAYRAHYTPASPQRQPYHADLTPEEQRFSLLFSVFPSFVATYIPHLTVYFCLRPASPSEVAIRWGITGHRREIDQPTLDEYVKFVDAFNIEDRAKLETLQRGLGSRLYTPGPLAPPDFEGTVWDFYRYMARIVGETPDRGSS